MRTDSPPRGRRRLAQVAVISFGLVGIVGSGGGIPGFPGFECCALGQLPPSVSITPRRLTVQVGSSATFSANASSFATASSLTLQWCRRPMGAAVCTDIPGATSHVYALPGANLGDDGAQFQVTVTDANGSAQDSGVLAVSSAPGVVISDGDFSPSDWTVTAVLGPQQGEATHTESRSATGGNPGAFRSVTYGLGQGANSVRLFHTWLAGTYDPAIQGAAYRVDFALDCARPSFAGEAQVPIASPMIEQGGRRFVPNATLIAGQWLCAYPEWQAQLPISSFAASEFVLADGPACGAGEACPDFSAQAAPLRFGFVTSIDVGTTSTGGIVVQGIDNWRVTVWRR